MIMITTTMILIVIIMNIISGSYKDNSNCNNKYNKNIGKNVVFIVYYSSCEVIGRSS